MATPNANFPSPKRVVRRIFPSRPVRHHPSSLKKFGRNRWLDKNAAKRGQSNRLVSAYNGGTLPFAPPQTRMECAPFFAAAILDQSGTS